MPTKPIVHIYQIWRAGSWYVVCEIDGDKREYRAKDKQDAYITEQQLRYRLNLNEMI